MPDVKEEENGAEVESYATEANYHDFTIASFPHTEPKQTRNEGITGEGKGEAEAPAAAAADVSLYYGMALFAPVRNSTGLAWPCLSQKLCAMCLLQRIVCKVE
ncbi:Hypothetical protein NTJ_02640 [Nesidiocoris tenuis]|uniref:CTNNB1 binding N-teminal domain-containing protein n=1 Tax=Nesidiocoris tenuis TaxID=355587 RepID=A0ABN7AC24_9HEMI|nr:Hypothetical protein NTJ_02640 [Nesidiocoris tenuis]